MTQQQHYSKWVSRLKLLFPIVAVLLVGAIFLMGRSEPELQDLPMSYQKIELTRKGPLMREPKLQGVTKQGNLYRVTAELAQPDPNNQNIVYLKNIVGITIDKKTTKTRQQISAPEGRLQRLADRLYMTGGVRLDDFRGYQLTSPTMEVDFRINLIQTQTPVIGTIEIGTIGIGTIKIGTIGLGTIETGKIEAGAMKADGQTSIIEFFNKVKTTYLPFEKNNAHQAPSPNAPIIITSETLTLDQNTHIGVFAGQIVAAQGASKLYSDKTAISIDPQTRQAQTLRAQGNVLLVSKNNSRATGDWAEHHIDSNIIYMGGGVTLLEQGNTLHGQALQVNTVTGKATLMGGETVNGKQRVKGIFTPNQ